MQRGNLEITVTKPDKESSNLVKMQDIKKVRARYNSSNRSPDATSIHGETNFAFDGTSDISSSGPGNKTTIVSFVINDAEHEEGDSCKEKARCKSHRSAISILLSILYAIILVLLGLIFPITEALKGLWLSDHVVGIYLVYLFSGSSIFLVYLQTSTYLEQRKREEERSSPPAYPNTGYTGSEKGSLEKSESPNIMVLRKRQAQSFTEETPPDDTGPKASTTQDASTASLEGSDFNQEIIENITFRTQTASLGHGAASVYLRLGALVFGIGNLIYVCLEMHHYIGSKKELEGKCVLPLNYPQVFQIFFLVIQTFFILKNTQISIKKNKTLAMFGFMHIFATNLCVWLRILVKEVQEGILHSNSDSHYGAVEHQMKPEMYASANSSKQCIDPNSLLGKAAPFLFPFVLEYSLIAVAVMAGMFSGLSVTVTQDLIESIRKSLKKRNKAMKQQLNNNPCPGHHDHHTSMLDKSHRGLFFGFLVLTGAIISIILFFHYNQKSETYYLAIGLYQTTDIAMQVLLLLALGLGFWKLFKLNFTHCRDNTIDHRLLVLSFIGMFLLEGFFALSMAAYLTYGTDTKPEAMPSLWLGLFSSLLNITQALLQITFVIDGLQRCTSDPEVKRRKPGRSTVTFLILTNVTLWIFKTFQAKELAINVPANYFGAVPWGIIFHITLPLALFFRFHSSVCLADIWSCAYEEEADDLEETELSDL